MFAFIQDQAQSDCFQAGAQTIAPLVPQTSVTYVEKGQPQKQSLWWWQFGRFELSCKHCVHPLKNCMLCCETVVVLPFMKICLLFVSPFQILLTG